MDKCCKTCEHYKCDTYCNSDNHKGVLVPDFTVCPDYKEKPINAQVLEFIQAYKDDILRVLATEKLAMKIGRWMWLNDQLYECSNCGSFSSYTSNYCHICGAKMEGYDYDTKRKCSG